MRKENSEFITDFITESGNFKNNRDYFAYVELDEMACWVLADGLDSDNDKLSSEIAVASIINSFTEKPSMKRRDLKKYIRRANEVLLHESKLIKLKATILVIITDYKSIIWANVGNTRVYHFRKERINFKSKDHSIAQMMLEVGDLEQRQLNQHKERNNLTQYLGKSKKVKPYVAKKCELKDDDLLLLATSGFWENITEEELTDILKESMKGKEFVENLQDVILEKGNGSLDNYSMVAISIKQIFKETVSKKPSMIKKIAVIMIPILVFVGGFALFTKIKRKQAEHLVTVKRMKAQKSFNLKQLNNSLKKEGQGDELYKQGEYGEAIKRYKEAKEVYKTLLKKEKEEAVAKKIEDTEILLKASDLEKRAKNYFDSANYKEALSKYNEAKLNYLKVRDYDFTGVEDSIVKTENILQAIAYEEEGDMFLKANNFSVAEEKYNFALAIYQKNELSKRIDGIKSKMNNTDKLKSRNKKVAQAQKTEEAGNELFLKNDFKNASLKYMEAKVIYSDLGLKDRVQRVDKKIDEVEIAKIYAQIKKAEDEANLKFNRDKYEEALSDYESIFQQYSDINKADDSRRVSKVIDEIKGIIKLNEEIAKVKKIEEKGDSLFDDKEYKDALDIYEKAYEMYVNLNQNEDSARVDGKIKKTKEKNKKFLFFF